jgi:hypothetical protein
MVTAQKQKLLFNLISGVLLLLIYAGTCFCQSVWEWRYPLPQGNNLNSVACGNGVFVAAGDYGTILTSSDGTAWTMINSGTMYNLRSVNYDNDQFV